MTSYTPAQLRAFEWLPEDGSWRSHPDDETRFAIQQLWALQEPKVMQGEWYECGWNGAPIRALRYRLTPTGIAERARLAKDGVIK